MSYPSSAPNYTQGFGSAPQSLGLPFYGTYPPTSVNTQGPNGTFQVGQQWVWPANGIWELLNFTSSNGTLSANWIQLASSTGDIVSVLGTTNQITATTAANVVTLSIPTTFVAPGSITSATTLTATLGAITATNGNLVLAGAGNKLVIHATTTASDSVGTSAAMQGTPGTVTVTTSACTTSSIILFARATTGGTPGQVSITTQSAGSFVLTSTGNETSTFNYQIIN